MQPQDVPTVIGGSVALSCGVVGSAASFVVKWTRNGSDLREDNSFSLTNTTWRNVNIFKLKIDGIRHRHTGKYRCIVTNAKGSVTSRKSRVYFSSKWLDYSSYFNVPVGDTPMQDIFEMQTAHKGKFHWFWCSLISTNHLES